jgi:hypothetical protein
MSYRCPKGLNRIESLIVSQMRKASKNQTQFTQASPLIGLSLRRRMESKLLKTLKSSWMASRLPILMSM